MSYYKFKKDDLFYNTIETWPEVQFDVYDHKVYLNNRNDITGAFVSNIGCVPTGYVSLFELNVDRDLAAQTYDPKTNPDGIKTKIFPFVTKDGSFEAVGNVSLQDYFSSFEYGDIITGSYPLSASLTRSGTFSLVRPHITALENTLNYYTPISPQYAFSSSLRDFANDDINFLNVPSIFYGSNIRRGSVHLKFYISGTFIAELYDKNFNGELIQVDGDSFAQTNGSDRIAGVVLYDEGIILLTGSWDLTPDTYDFGIGGAHAGRWLDFAAGAHDGTTDVTDEASFLLNFEGKKYVQTLTMHAQASKPDLNFSSNPTFLDHTSYASKPPLTNLYSYKEQEDIQIFNTVTSSFFDYEERFKNQTFIGKIGIYDNAKNLIAIAKLATPIKKNTQRDFTFKLKIDF
jgi:hypothetical protein